MDMTKEQCEYFIKDLPDYFYIALFGEMCSIDTSITRETVLSNELNVGGTGLWAEAMNMCCRKLDIKDFMSKYNKLEWYDSDNVDYEIECKMIEVLNKEKDISANSYYRYMVNLK
jgi:hypothetical protein